MEVILHWDFSAHNFVNKGEVTLKTDGKGHPVPKNNSSAVSLKKRLGHKPNNLQQRLVLQLPDGNINLKWKKAVEALILKHKDLMKNGRRPKCYIGGHLYNLPCTRQAKEFSNTLGNIYLAQKRLDNLSIDNIITISNNN